MAETKPLTAEWMHEVIRISEPLRIGEHAWRRVQDRDTTDRNIRDEATGFNRLADPEGDGDRSGEPAVIWSKLKIDEREKMLRGDGGHRPNRIPWG